MNGRPEFEVEATCPRCGHTFALDVEMPQDEHPEAERQYKLAELEKILSLSRRALKEHIYRGRLRAHKASPNSPWYVTSSSLDRFRKLRRER